jgi:uroporphyrinogen-III synthase
MQGLDNVNILVTRPRAQSESLLQALRDQGAEAVLFPTLEIEPLPDVTLPALGDLDIAIFLSPNAVRCATELFTNWPENCQVVSMGSGTTQMLTQAGLMVNHQAEPGGTSESLLQAPILQAVADKQIAVFAGEGGRSVLFDGLREGGAKVKKIVVYKRLQPKTKMPIFYPKPDLIISTSGESLQNLQAMLQTSGQQSLCQLPLLIVSQRMVNLAKALGFSGPLLIAAGAGNEAIIHCLSQWREAI